MSNPNMKMMLYIVKPGDTLEGIAQQFQTTKEEIYRLNAVMKYHHIYAGMPIHIAVPAFGMDTREIAIEKPAENRETLLSLSLLYHDLAFYEKEAIAFQFLYDKYVAVLTNKIQKTMQKILSVYIKAENILSDLQDILMRFHHALLDLCKAIQEKKNSVLPSIKANLTECIKKLLQKAQDISLKKEVITFLENTFSHILLLWQNYILHISGQKLPEAEDDFIRLLHDYEEVNQALMKKEKK